MLMMHAILQRCLATSCSVALTAGAGTVRTIAAAALHAISTDSSASHDSPQQTDVYGPEASTSAPVSWTNKSVKHFSIRPSYLSPLFLTFQQEQAKSQRRQLLSRLLEAHTQLAREVEGYDDEQLQRSTRYRIAQLQELASDLQALLSQDQAPSNISDCRSQDLMFGFFKLLEQQATKVDPDSTAFNKVQQGRADVWDHWYHRFVQAYSNTPGLEPLHEIYTKSDPFKGMLKKLSSPVRPVARSTGPQRLGPHMKQSGVSVSVGKRKASLATVHMAEGHGLITVNKVPIDEYFRDVGVRQHVVKPFAVADALGIYDVDVRVQGGGLSGQAQAVRTGIARALVVHAPRLAEQLSELTRWDGRVVERKKPARKKARRGFQWVKR